MSQRVPLRGSCHCGQTKYILYLTLPHTPSEILPAPRGTQHIYRCNCTTCHKTGHMHVRPSDPASDFLLLNPLSLDELGDYRTGDGVLRFLFCKTCAVRCFIFAGDDGEEVADVAVPGIDEKIEKAWRPKPNGGHPKMGHYISINAHTIDAGQPQFDMRTLTEDNKVMYCDCYSPEEDEAPMRYGRPQENGCY